MNEYKIFAVFNKGDVTLHQDFNLLPDNYISIMGQEATPIEDFGDWMLFKEVITKEEAWRRFLNCL
jgi:hypothetical protein